VQGLAHPRWETEPDGASHGIVTVPFREGEPARRRSNRGI
jgi:hypothetical protein